MAGMYRWAPEGLAGMAFTSPMMSLAESLQRCMSFLVCSWMWLT